ncbi:MAG: hypothetical protein R6X34_27570 [Chloroflexota bacterium]
MISYRRSFFTGLLGFIVAGIASNLATLLLFASGVLTWLTGLVPEGQPLVRLLVGVILAFVGVGVGGAVGGLVRGYVLQRIDAQGSRPRYLTSAALANGLAHGVLVIPALLLISLISVYNPGSEKNPTIYMVVFGLLGVLFGLLNGFVLAALTARPRYALLPWLANAAGSLLGGVLFGLVLWRPAWLASSPVEALTGALFLIIAGVVMNATTGGMLGLAYGWLARQRQMRGEAAVTPRRWQDAATIAVGTLLFLVVMGSTNQIANFITIHQGSIRTSLTPVTEGVHWQDVSRLTEIQPDEASVGLAAGAAGQVLVWSGADDVFYSNWPDAPVNVSNTPQNTSHQPQAAVTEDGAAYIVWAEAGRILVSRCAGGVCSPPLGMAAIPSACNAGAHQWPAIAVDDAGTVMVAWSAGQNAIAYTTWQDGQDPANGRSGCLTFPDLPNPQAQLAATPEGFALVAAAAPNSPTGPISWASFGPDGWSAPQVVGQGGAAAIHTAADGRWHSAWCSAAGGLVILSEGGGAENLTGGCTTRPALLEDGTGRLHVPFVPTIAVIQQ